MSTFARAADDRLLAWYRREDRKPLILRGARQTGKSTAVRRLAQHVPRFIELNLERHEDLARVQACRSAAELLETVRVTNGMRSLPSGTLLFLDEIQEHPDALPWLRFLYEDHPELAVVAAGSLLEVQADARSLSFPVGRVEFLRIEPLTFLEFLDVTGDAVLADELRAQARSFAGIPGPLHRAADRRLREFLVVGGMPEAVARWARHRDPVEVGRFHDDLRQAYRDDLLKYGGPRREATLEALLDSAPAHWGKRFKMQSLAPGLKNSAIAHALDQLECAQVLHRAAPTASLHQPFEPRPKAAHKLLPLDIGLALAHMEVRREQLRETEIEALLDGRIAECFVGIQLLAHRPERMRSLWFWTRQSRSSADAEVDYLVPREDGLTPCEVKAGAAGRLRSLHQYLLASEESVGVRLSSSPGRTEDLTVGLPQGGRLRYRLRNVPLYLAELLPDAGALVFQD